MMHLRARKWNLNSGFFRRGTKGLKALPSPEEACFKAGIHWNKVLLQTQADVLAARIAALSVKINMQRLPNPCVPATCLGSFSRDQEKIQDLHHDRCYFQRRQPADFADRDHVLLCALEQVQEILIYLIQNSTWDLAVSCGVGPFPSPISILLNVQMLDNAGFCYPHWVTCHS